MILTASTGRVGLDCSEVVSFIFIDLVLGSLPVSNRHLLDSAEVRDFISSILTAPRYELNIGHF